MGRFRRSVAFGTAPLVVVALATAVQPRAAAAVPPAVRLLAAAAPSCPAGVTAPRSSAAAAKVPAVRALKLATAVAADAAYAAPDAPRRMIPADQYTVRVTVRNTTGATLPSGSYVLSYHWSLPNGDDYTEAGGRLETALPADLAPGAAVDLDAAVRAPRRADIGNSREQFVLRWDLRDRVKRTWLSETAGVPTLDQDVTVEYPTSDQLGLEKFYQYSAIGAGAGSQLLVNQFAGNAVFNYDALSLPSLGPHTFLRLTYNSQDTSDSSYGYGWSISASTMTRLGSPLEFHGGGTYPARVTMVDGDGTGHEFELAKDKTYDSPAGVNVLLERSTGTDRSRRWVLTSPDRTRAYFDDGGRQTAIADHNGRELLFGYEAGYLGNRNTEVLRTLTDATGRRTLTLDYYQPGDSYAYYAGTTRRTATNLSNAAIAYQLRSVTDLTGRTLTFTYSEDGLLQELVDGAGTSVAKPFTFFYDTVQGDRNAKLVRVVDPNGGASDIGYYTDSAKRWHARTLTSRVGGGTTFGYADADGTAGSAVLSTVTDANGHTSNWTIDGFGRPERLTNAKGEVTSMVWDADNNVVRLTDNSGALTTWEYDPRTGLPLRTADPEANAHGHPATTFEYRTELAGHVADLVAQTSPEGRRVTAVYDERGNMVAGTDPKGNVTRYSHDELGNLSTVTDPNGGVTRYGDYDPSGGPRRITDALGCTSFVLYDPAGNAVSSVDAAGKVRTFRYDVFNRPLASTLPKDAAAGENITTPGAVYDQNDNVVKYTAANGAVVTSTYDEADRQVSVSAPKDTADGPARITTYTYDKVGNVLREVAPKGTLTADPDDFRTTYTYDEVNRPIRVTDPAGDTSTMSYDRVGNLIKEVDPKKTASADPDDFTAKYEYDLNRRLVRTVDATGASTSSAYDRDGNVVRTTDEEGNVTTLTLDERAMPVELRAPYSDGILRTTRFEYDQVGNRVRTISPRGTETAEPDDFVQAAVYDKLNRVVTELLPYDPGDGQVNQPDQIAYTYDAVGALREVSSPPSRGQSVRVTQRYTYFDNGWLRSAVDPHGITTTYDYNALGQQTRRTSTSAGGGADRTQSWSYFPDGKLRVRSDAGVPVGRHVVLVDNSDANDTTADGAWDTVAGSTETEGFDYRTHVAGTGADTFTWRADIPADGRYEVFARYAAGTATDAKYTVEHDGGSSTATVDQTQHAGEWVSLGTFTFSAGTTRPVRLTDEANGTVVADAVRLVRDNSGDTDTENKVFTHTYDANANLTTLIDSSPDAVVDRYETGYDAVNRVTRVAESRDGTVRNATAYSYDANGNMLDWRHDDQTAAYEYDARDLATKVTNRETRAGAEPKVSTFAYTARGYLSHEVKPNGNTVDLDYYRNGMLRHRADKKADGTVVAEHTLDYDANGNRVQDVSHVKAAGAAGYRDHTFSYVYDPRDRIRTVTKAAPGGSVESTESYTHDANNNIVEQTAAGVSTSFRYDRNRLVSATKSGVTLTYGYDPFGRLVKSTAQGQEIERYAYDGFDRITEQRRRLQNGTATTRYAYDPLDRTRTRTENAGAAGAKTTEMLYQGMSDQVLSERVDGRLAKVYHYGPSGRLIAQVSLAADSTAENAYVGQNAHSDVESLTGDDGEPLATYGYTAYGADDPAEFTGADAANQQDTGAAPYNQFRFNAKRFDVGSGNYDMGFRDYSPQQGRFLSLDSYNGGLSDQGLSLSPLTSNRYGFGGGNPLSTVEIDGHEGCGWNPFCYIEKGADKAEEWLDCATNIMCPKENPDADGDGYVSPGDLYQNYAEDKCAEMSDWRAQSICAGTVPALADIVDVAADLGPVPLNQASRCFQGSVSGCVWTGVSALGLVFDAAGASAAASTFGKGAQGTSLVGKVAYGSTDLSRLVIGKRWTAIPALLRTPPNGAAIEAVVNGTTHTAWAFSYPWFRGGKHAERLAWAILEAKGIRGDQVTRVYSELQPCKVPSQCSSFIARTFPNAKVTWSFDYGDTPASRQAGVAALQAALDFLFG